MNNQLISPLSIVKTFALSGFTASVICVASPAQAVVFNIQGTNYDITIVEGSYNSLKTQLEATPWWRDDWLFATGVASLVGTSLGTPNWGGSRDLQYDTLGRPFFDLRGPWFAFATSFEAGEPSVARAEGIYLFDALNGAFAGSQPQSRYSVLRNYVTQYPQ